VFPQLTVFNAREGRVLDLVDECLELFLRASVPLKATDIDVSFEAPDREWAAKLTRPTINLFLWDIRRSAERSKSGMATVVRDGTRVHQPAHPVVELRYVVTAWTSDHGDERVLLAGVMRSLLAYSSVPREHLPGPIAHLKAPTLAMARAGEDHMDVFKALEGKVKPGLNLVMTSEFDTGVFTVAGPPIDSIETAVGFINGGTERRRRIAGQVHNADEIGAIGATARSSIDATTVNGAGQFLLRAVPGDEITLDVDPPLVVVVPAVGGVEMKRS
jgi:hypothetical protein